MALSPKRRVFSVTQSPFHAEKASISMDRGGQSKMSLINDRCYYWYVHFQTLLLVKLQ
jgi:hypothetical protein